MHEFSMIVTVGTFLAAIFMSSQYFYTVNLNIFSKRLLGRLEIDIEQLNYSFEQIVFLVSLPSNLPQLTKAKKTDVVIQKEYSFLLFPELKGIKVYLQMGKNKTFIAYLPVKDFRLPKLDRLLVDKKITENEYLKISAFQLIHPTTLKKITDETIKRLHIGMESY
jgi:hypothetical protein